MMGFRVLQRRVPQLEELRSPETRHFIEPLLLTLSPKTMLKWCLWC